jgi:hypothetical protein
LGDENAKFVFGNQEVEYFYAISIERARYKEKLLPGSFELSLTMNSGIETKLIDDSSIKSSVTFTDAGRVYNIVSGSINDGVNTSKNSEGWTHNSGSYGFFLPDISTILLSGLALDSGKTENGGIELTTLRGSDTKNENPEKLFNAIDALGPASPYTSNKNFKLNSEETLSSDFIFVRARNNEFNYSENPSFISGSTGAVVFDDFIDNPTSYITTVGLYNDNNELLAVAKLSRPLPKDFTKELLVRVKLDF